MAEAEYTDLQGKPIKVTDEQRRIADLFKQANKHITRAESLIYTAMATQFETFHSDKLHEHLPALRELRNVTREASCAPHIEFIPPLE